MSQQKIMMICLVVVAVLFGSMTIYAIKESEKYRRIFKKPDVQWKWDDSWNNHMPTNPSHEKMKHEAKPKTQVVAETYKEALQKSEELKRPILVFYTADWCGFCKKMKSETLTNPKVIEGMKKYIFVSINTDKDRSGIGKFGVTGLPSYVITNHNEDKLKVGSGYVDPEKFVKWLE